MRIISQDGKLDIGYDRLLIEIVGCLIKGYDYTDYGSTSMHLATYSTPEKAAEEMERLHLTYIKQRKVTTKTGAAFQENYPKVFKFRTDEEVEDDKERSKSTCLI